MALNFLPIDTSILDPGNIVDSIDDAVQGVVGPPYRVTIINPTSGPIFYSFMGETQTALPSHVKRTHTGKGSPEVRFDRGLNDGTVFDYNLDSGRTYYFDWVRRDMPEIGVVNMLDLFLGFPPSNLTGGQGSSALEIGNTVTLKCLGSLDGPRFLDGHTANGTVALAPQTGGGFTGTKWKVLDGHNGTIILQCLGTVPGNRFLDGRTANGTVGLAPQTGQGFSGTHWKVRHSGDAFVFECRGTLPGSRFLDGHTANGKVALAPQAGGAFSGTRWKVTTQG